MRISENRFMEGEGGQGGRNRQAQEGRDGARTRGADAVRRRVRLQAQREVSGERETAILDRGRARDDLSGDGAERLRRVGRRGKPETGKVEAKRALGAAVGIVGRQSVVRRGGGGGVSVGRRILQDQIFVFECAEQHREGGEQGEDEPGGGAKQSDQRVITKGAKKPD